MSLNSLIIQLAEARQRSEDIKLGMRLMLDSVINTPEYKEFESDLNKSMAAEFELRSQIDELALLDYDANGNKKPHAAVTVKEFHEIELLDDGAIREWCFDNYRPALNFDPKLIINAAKDGLIPTKFFKSNISYRPQVSKDLSGYLPKEETDDNTISKSASNGKPQAYLGATDEGIGQGGETR